MKAYLITIFYLIYLNANGQNWQWSDQVGGNATQSFEEGHVISDGINYYLIGSFSGTMILPTDTFFNTNGNNDLYVIKYDNSGNELWAKAFGGNNSSPNQIESIGAVYDPISNSIFMRGKFYGAMSLDTITIVSDSHGRNFIARMDLNGNFLWGKRAWIRNSDDLNDIEPEFVLNVRSDGVFYLCADVLDTAYFDTNIVNPGGCIAKYDSSGNCLFVSNTHQFSSGLSQGGLGIDFINKDLIFFGSFKQTLLFDTTSLTSNGDYDIIICRTDSEGHVKWIKTFGNQGGDGISDIAIDDSGKIYCSAIFTDSISINGNRFYDTGSDILLFKLDSNGTYIWGRQINVTGNILGGNSIASDSNGNCYLAGAFSGSAHFGVFNVSTSNLDDMFLSRYDYKGNCMGVIHWGRAGSSDIIIDNAGNPVTSGIFSNSVTIGTQNFTSNGPFDIFLAKCDIFTDVSEEGRVSNNNLIIYTNPNQGKFNINVPDDFMNEKNLTLSIFDNSGKLIQRKTMDMSGEKIRVNIEAESKGMYNVILSNGSKSYSGKIVFE